MKRIIGFTLIEMLVAIVLLAIISAALIAFMPAIVTLNRRSSQEQEITVAAKSFFEEVRRTWTARDAFDAGTLPASPEGCTAQVSDPDAGAPGIRHRVTLTCEGLTTPFITDFGRPQ